MSGEQNVPTRQSATRRDVLGVGAALAGLVALAGTPAGAKDDDNEHGQMDHSKMDHSKMDHSAGAAPAAQPGKHQSLIDAALACVKHGETCEQHCISALASGDTSLKACLATVRAMLPMCGTLASLAAMDAARLKEFAKVCADVCDDCEKECKKHAEHHAVCKACGESCAACIKACKAVIDA